MNSLRSAVSQVVLSDAATRILWQTTSHRAIDFPSRNDSTLRCTSAAAHAPLNVQR